MADSPAYREYVVEQIGRVVPVTARKMFGGVSLYSEGLIFALLAADEVYFKVDDTNRADFEAIGSGPFRPFGDRPTVMQYYRLPDELLEDPDALRPWVEKALDVSRRAARSARKK